MTQTKTISEQMRDIWGIKAGEYKIISYSESTREHQVRNLATGQIFNVDLFVDASFENSPLEQFEKRDELDDRNTREEVIQIEESLVGKTIHIESFTPLTYAARGVKIV